MPLLTRFFALVSILMMAGCAAPIQWQNAEVPEEQWKADQRACRAEARREVNAQLDRNYRLYGNQGTGRSSDFNTLMTRYTAGRSEKSFFEDCMKRTGYRKVRLKSK